MKIELNTLVCPIITPDTYGTNFQYTIADDCWDDFKTMFCEIAAKYIKSAIKETKDFVSCSVTVYPKLISPRQYNYVTDSINFDVDVSDEIIETLKTERISDQFIRYIKKFGSHAGFISNYPTTKTEVEEAFEDPKSDKFALLIAEFIMYEFEYLTDSEAYQADFIEEVMDEVAANGYEDYDDSLEDESVVNDTVNDILEGADISATISKVAEQLRK